MVIEAGKAEYARTHYYQTSSYFISISSCSSREYLSLHYRYSRCTANSSKPPSSHRSPNSDPVATFVPRSTFTLAPSYAGPLDPSPTPCASSIAPSQNIHIPPRIAILTGHRLTLPGILGQQLIPPQLPHCHLPVDMVQVETRSSRLTRFAVSTPVLSRSIRAYTQLISSHT